MELNVLGQIAKTSSKNDKKKLLKDNNKNAYLALLLDAALNYKRRFFVNKFDMPEPVKANGIDQSEFMLLLMELENRVITGHTAKFAVEELFSRCTALQQDWYSRVLRKDLKAGFSVDTAVEAGFNIPVFDVMLAKDGKECKNLDKIVSNGVYASPKFDGYRCLAVVESGHVTLYSRNGTIFTNFPSIEASLATCFPIGNYVFDGEIMSDDFQSMQKSAFASKRGTTVGDVKYFIFGYIPYNEWSKLDFMMVTSDRIEELKKLAVNFDSRLILVDQQLVHKVDDILALEANLITQGYEGVMILPQMPYYLGKKTNKMMKFKTFISWDCEITGFYEGKEGTKHVGRLGGLIVKQENGIECRGAGELSDEDREYIWTHQDEFLGRIAEFSYQNLTDDGVMRFPQFRRWRNDK